MIRKFRINAPTGALTWLNMCPCCIFRQSLSPEYFRNLAGAQEIVGNHLVVLIVMRF